ncbi:MAG: 16S rRNA (uracil(1498)-N(3))-methyltransferase [Bacteroidetes bacterium]|nr:16S rRNA (uracil(1498)-N(3))-methyltransferase [Bacteroidota bacterium]
MQLFYQPDIKKGIHFLNEEESRHCIKVLRKTRDDIINITDGKGLFFTACITQPDFRKCGFDIVDIIREPQKNHSIHIAISPVKNMDRTAWFVEKSVELGIDRISFIRCAHSERTTLKTDRLEKKVIAAIKQSVRATIPAMYPLKDFEEFLKSQAESNEMKFIAFVDDENPALLFKEAIPGRNYCVLIGPEGDFTEKEIMLASDCDYKKVSLGKHRLRTETAGIAACHILNLVNE